MQNGALVFDGKQLDIRKKSRPERAADLVRELYDGQPVRVKTIAKRLGLSQNATSNALGVARDAGLVQVVYQRGWLPGGARISWPPSR